MQFHKTEMTKKDTNMHIHILACKCYIHIYIMYVFNQIYIWTPLSIDNFGTNTHIKNAYDIIQRVCVFVWSFFSPSIIPWDECHFTLRRFICRYVSAIQFWSKMYNFNLQSFKSYGILALINDLTTTQCRSDYEFCSQI